MDIIYKIALIENVMSIRPMLVNSTDQHSTVITPRLLFHPFMTSEAVTLGAIDMFHHIFTEFLINNHLIRSGLRQAIVCYLQTSALRYRTWKKIKIIPYANGRGCNNVQRQKGKKVFGVIIEILKMY